MFTKWAILAHVIHATRAVPQASTTTAPAGVTTGVPTITLATSVASPTASLTATLPSQVALPPVQAWCPSEIFCPGALLQTVNVAELWSDQKTFVDKPTNSNQQSVLAAFAAINATNATEGAVLSFVDNNFRGEGLELEAQALPSFNANPPFLNNVTDPLLRGFAQIVHSYWTQLIRGTNSSTLCDGKSCESTLIPLNHTFVVPGGRFREQYYWDSFWIIEGLIQSQLFDVAKETLQNFMDEIELFGFIPNGGRIYYLNRSQPPLFIWMLATYVTATNDTTILDRALPLAERELAWWSENRSITVTSPYTNKTYTLSRYAVTNSAPRPESYLTDYKTVNDPSLKIPLNESQQAELYSELATGAETGWDYSTRFISLPVAGGSNNTAPALRSLNVKNHIPVDLNSILYKSNLILANFYNSGSHVNSTAASTHTETAANIRAGIIDLLWDSSKLAFYDFNLTSNSRNGFFSAATFYPLWAGIVPDELVSNSTNAFGFFSSINMVLRRYNGTYPTTFVESGLQWDAPNAWPPHQYIALQALRALPANVSSGAIPQPPSGKSAFALVPSGQLGLEESALPGQVVEGGKNASSTGSSADINALNGTFANGGNATAGEGWRDALARGLANRYITSALCSWHATGGSIPNLFPRLTDQQLNVSQSINNTGNMFEKFSTRDIDSGGRGGEYTVQAGFGWTNGVVLWVANTFGSQLVEPKCPDPIVEASISGTTGSGGKKNGALQISVAPRALFGLGLLTAGLQLLIV
ncbi:glycoside hydrolase [Multifurca ochricompacta]|uniref:Trehalase n=1 Tax=Multifurca ochricompacta TaxID=376703 RepID=A0AAD4M180_9AGAM|nr:glycoside hydrolase [Multifurca ochricompacta]